MDQSGATRSHVFRGKIELRAAGRRSGTENATLGENESARVERGRGPGATVRRVAARAEGFTRHMPEPPPQVLLRDTFDNQKDSDAYGPGYGLNECLSTRQSGPYRPAFYLCGGDCVAIGWMAQVSNPIATAS